MRKAIYMIMAVCLLLFITDCGANAASNPDSAVYFTSDISPEGMVAIYEALGWTPTGNVAVKLSTGEPPASNYLRPELIKDVVDTVNGTFAEILKAQFAKQNCYISFCFKIVCYNKAPKSNRLGRARKIEKAYPSLLH